MQSTYHHFPNIGYLTAKFEEIDLLPIRMEIDDIQSNFDAYESFTPNLAGHLTKEYELKESCSHIEQLVLPLIDQFDYSFDYLKKLNYLDHSLPWGIGRTWVNFQKKYEFNPVHSHTGVFSFVIYIKITNSKND